MIKVIQVREFDKLTSNKNFKDNSKYVFVEKKYFKQVKDFIANEFPQEDENILDFASSSTNKGAGEIISFKNYVGILNINDDLQIEVLPKIDFIPELKDTKDVIKATKEIFLKMMKSLLNISNKTFHNANLDSAKMPLFEIFISMYVAEVREITRRGLKSNYIEVEENKNVLKGKLLFNEHIKKNLAHKERFYVAYDEYGLNRPENKLIKSTLLELQKMTSSSLNSKHIKQELAHFEDVEQSFNYHCDFSRICLDRNTKLYEQALAWSKIFLNKKSFTTFSGTSNAKAILFPMEKVYEEYVAKQMRHVAYKRDWSLKAQDRKYNLFDKLCGEEQSCFRLKPDIVIGKGNRDVVLDTKWKRLVDNKSMNFGISQSDMYQMYAYSKKYNQSDVWLLYPVTPGMIKYKDSEHIIKYSSNDEVNVSIYFIDLQNIQSDLDNLINLIEKDENSDSQEQAQ